MAAASPTADNKHSLTSSLSADAAEFVPSSGGLVPLVQASSALEQQQQKWQGTAPMIAEVPRYLTSCFPFVSSEGVVRPEVPRLAQFPYQGLSSVLPMPAPPPIRFPTWQALRPGFVGTYPAASYGSMSLSSLTPPLSVDVSKVRADVLPVTGSQLGVAVPSLAGQGLILTPHCDPMTSWVIGSATPPVFVHPQTQPYTSHPQVILATTTAIGMTMERSKAKATTAAQNEVTDGARPQTPVVISRSCQTNLPAPVKDLTLQEKPHPLYVPQGKICQSKQSQQSPTSEGQTWKEGDQDSDSGYNSPMHRPNVVSSGTQVTPPDRLSLTLKSSDNPLSFSHTEQHNDKRYNPTAATRTAAGLSSVKTSPNASTLKSSNSPTKGDHSSKNMGATSDVMGTATNIMGGLTKKEGGNPSSMGGPSNEAASNVERKKKRRKGERKDMSRPSRSLATNMKHLSRSSSSVSSAGTKAEEDNEKIDLHSWTDFPPMSTRAVTPSKLAQNFAASSLGVDHTPLTIERSADEPPWSIKSQSGREATHSHSLSGKIDKVVSSGHSPKPSILPAPESAWGNIGRAFKHSQRSGLDKELSTLISGDDAILGLSSPGKTGGTTGDISSGGIRDTPGTAAGHRGGAGVKREGCHDQNRPTDPNSKDGSGSQGGDGSRQNPSFSQSDRPSSAESRDKSRGMTTKPSTNLVKDPSDRKSPSGRGSGSRDRSRSHKNLAGIGREAISTPTPQPSQAWSGLISSFTKITTASSSAVSSHHQAGDETASSAATLLASPAQMSSPSPVSVMTPDLSQSMYVSPHSGTILPTSLPPSLLPYYSSSSLSSCMSSPALIRATRAPAAAAAAASPSLSLMSASAAAPPSLNLRFPPPPLGPQPLSVSQGVVSPYPSVRSYANIAQGISPVVSACHNESRDPRFKSQLPMAHAAPFPGFAGAGTLPTQVGMYHGVSSASNTRVISSTATATSSSTAYAQLSATHQQPHHHSLHQRGAHSSTHVLSNPSHKRNNPHINQRDTNQCPQTHQHHSPEQVRATGPDETSVADSKFEVNQDRLDGEEGKKRRKRRRGRGRSKKGGKDVEGGDLSDGSRGMEHAVSSSNVSESTLHFEDVDEFPDHVTSTARSLMEEHGGERSALSGIAVTYSDIIKSTWSKTSSRAQSLTGSVVSGEDDDNTSCHTGTTNESKKDRKRRKRREQANKAAEAELAEISLEQEWLKEVGLKKTTGGGGPLSGKAKPGIITDSAVVGEAKKQAKGGGGGGGRKSQQPIAFDIAAMIDAIQKTPLPQPTAAATALKKQSQGNSSAAMSKPSKREKERGGGAGVSGLSSLPGNVLDSSAPMHKRGKEREVVKTKKPSPLKKVILKEREQRKRLRLLDEDPDSAAGLDTVGSSPGVGIVGGESELSQDALSSKSEGTDEGEETGNAELSADLSPISQTSPISMSPASPGNSGLNSPVTGSVGRDPVVMKIHSRRFREYCTQILDKEIDQCCTSLLQDLVKFQDRMYHKDPVKAKTRRRVVLGLREVTKHLKLKKIKCVVISPNLEKIQSKGGLDEALNNILNMCRDQDVPFVFALGRRALGRACAKLVPVSVVGIFNYDGCEAKYRNLISLTSAARTAYNEMVLAVEKEVAEYPSMASQTSSIGGVPGLFAAHMGHSRTPSGCSAISFTSSILSEPISENFPHAEPEVDSKGYEIVRDAAGNVVHPPGGDSGSKGAHDSDDGNEADTEDFGERKRKKRGGKVQNSVRFGDIGGKNVNDGVSNNVIRNKNGKRTFAGGGADGVDDGCSVGTLTRNISELTLTNDDGGTARRSEAPTESHDPGQDMRDGQRPGGAGQKGQGYASLEGVRKKRGKVSDGVDPNIMDQVHDDNDDSQWAHVPHIDSIHSTSYSLSDEILSHHAPLGHDPGFKGQGLTPGDLDMSSAHHQVDDDFHVDDDDEEDEDVECGVEGDEVEEEEEEEEEEKEMSKIHHRMIDKERIKNWLESQTNVGVGE